MANFHDIINQLSKLYDTEGELAAVFHPSRENCMNTYTILCCQSAAVVHNEMTVLYLILSHCLTCNLSAELVQGCHIRLQVQDAPGLCTFPHQC